MSDPGRGGHDHGVGAWRLASLRDWRRESRRFSAARFSAAVRLLLHSARASSASPNFLQLQHYLAETRRAAPRGDDVRVFVVDSGFE